MCSFTHIDAELFNTAHHLSNPLVRSLGYNIQHPHICYVYMGQVDLVVIAGACLQANLYTNTVAVLLLTSKSTAYVVCSNLKVKCRSVALLEHSKMNDCHPVFGYQFQFWTRRSRARNLWTQQVPDMKRRTKSIVKIHLAQWKPMQSEHHKTLTSQNTNITKIDFSKFVNSCYWNWL